MDEKIRKYALIILTVLTCLLLVLGYHTQGQPQLINVPLWDLQYTHRIKDFLVAILKNSLLQVGLYLLIGFLAALGFSSRQSQGIGRLTYLYAVSFGIILSTLISAIASTDLTPNILDIVLPVVGCLIGAWIGVHWAVGGKARKRIWLKLTFLASSLTLLIIVVVKLALDEIPLPFEAEQLKSEDRVRLIKLIRSKNPRYIADGEIVNLTLSEHDINLLLTWGLSLGSPDRKARVSLGEELTTIYGSIGFPIIGDSKRYINFSAAVRMSVQSGEINGEIKQLTIGDISLPSFLLKILSSAIITKVIDEPLFRPVLTKIISTEINQRYISVSYRKVNIPEGFRDRLFAPIGSPEAMKASLAAQFDVIRQINDSLPKGEKVNLGVFMRSAFALAYQRSAQGDPVMENRAAVIALGIAIGHRVIARFINNVPYETIPAVNRHVTVYQRADWSKHFLVSAALEIISSEAISLDIGLLKEELDSGKGGSGFSFGDLAADRSGTMFAKIATLNREAAETIQLRMIQGFSIDDYIPAISDLPENIPAEDFASDYGGTGGRRYQMILKEIDRRIAHCAAYR